MKSGQEFILKLTEPLLRYLLTCQANSALLGRFFCTGQQQLWRGSVNFKINSRPLFIIIFKLKNVNFKTRDFSPLIPRVLSGVDYKVGQKTHVCSQLDFCQSHIFYINSHWFFSLNCQEFLAVFLTNWNIGAQLRMTNFGGFSILNFF